MSLSKSLTVALTWFSGSPSAALSSAGKIREKGATVRIPQQITVCVSCQDEFRDRLFWRATQGISGSWGALYFGYFTLGKQRKVTRLEAKNTLAIHNNKLS